MACTPPTEVSQIYQRTACCQRWAGRLALLLVLVVALVISSRAAHLIKKSDDLSWGSVVAAYSGLMILAFTLSVLALRRFRASHHAQVKANQLMALELLASKATDPEMKQALAKQMAEAIVGKSTCCK